MIIFTNHRVYPTVLNLISLIQGYNPLPKSQYILNVLFVKQQESKVTLLSSKEFCQREVQISARYLRQNSGGSVTRLFCESKKDQKRKN